MFVCISVKNSWLVSACGLLKKICVLQRTCLLLWARTSCDGCVQRSGCMTGGREWLRCLLALLCASVWLLCQRRAHRRKRQMSRVPQEAWVRSRWGERRAPSSFHSMDHMKAFYCPVFVYPVLPSFLHELTLNCFILYTPPWSWCRHTHTCRKSRLLVLFSPARSLLAGASQMFRWLMGSEVWRRSLPPLPSHPFLPSPLVLLTFLPSPIPSMFECRSVRTHTHRHTHAHRNSHQMLVRVVTASQSCALSLGQLLYCLRRCWRRHVLSGWRDCRWLARLWHSAAEGFLTECEIGGCLFLPPAIHTA